MAAAVLGEAAVDVISSYASLLVPVATGLVGWLAYLGARRGNRVEESQQAAKNKLDERAQSFNEVQAVNERLTQENTRLQAARDSEDARHRDELARAEAGCLAQVEQLTATLEILRTVVLDEVAKAAAGAVVDAAKGHVERHDQGTPDGSP